MGSTDTQQVGGQTSTQVGAQKKKRVSVYTVRLTAKFELENDDAQACINKKKKLEELAKEQGGFDIEAAGAFGSTTR